MAKYGEIEGRKGGWAMIDGKTEQRMFLNSTNANNLLKPLNVLNLLNLLQLLKVLHLLDLLNLLKVLNYLDLIYLLNFTPRWGRWRFRHSDD